MQAEEKELDGTLAATSAKVHVALLDSIDVCTAMTALLDLVSKTNIYIKAREQHYAATPRGVSRIASQATSNCMLSYSIHTRPQL